MTRPVCTHCNGTTFCGGFKRKGPLVTQPACTTCLVKSGLPPKEVHHRVICAVCGGTGLMPPRKRATGPSLVIAAPLLIAAGAFLTLGIVGFYRYLTKSEEVKQGIENTVNTTALPVSTAELREKLTMGMSKDDLLKSLGNPNFAKSIDNGDSSLDLWYYQCADGRVLISMRDDKIISVH